MLLVTTLLASILHIIACMHGSSGCIGCDINRKLKPSVDGLPKGQKFNSRTVAKPIISVNFWSNGTLDVDNSAFQSQGSISSTSTSTLNDATSSGNGNVPSGFVNHGLLFWNQTRQQWVGKKKFERRAQQMCEPRLSWNGSYESLVRSNKRFNKPIPLAEMTDFLVDIWEQEGMYD